MIKGIIFDMDGVILDSEKLHAKVEQKLFKDLKIEMTEEEKQRFIGIPFKRALIDFIRRKKILHDPDEVTELKIKRMLNVMDKLHTIPQTVDFIKKYHGKFRFAVVTSTEKELTIPQLERFGLLEYFDAIITPELVSNPKPDPEPFKIAARKLNLKKYECIIIEDSINGIKSAKSAGIKVVGLEGTFPAEKLDYADLVVDEISYEKLRPLLE